MDTPLTQANLNENVSRVLSNRLDDDDDWAHFTHEPLPRTRARHWFFTENNPEGALDVVFSQLLSEGKIDYCTWQLEIGKKTGTEHYQGYVNFKKQTLFTTVTALLPRARWAMCLDPIAARAYCQKNDTRIEGPFELGIWNPPHEKQRVWKMLADDIKAGHHDYYLFDKYPMQVMTHFKGIAHARNVVLPPRDFKTKTILIFGLPGCGKSRYVHQSFPQAYWKSPDSSWFDGYGGQPHIIFDDFYGWIPLGTFLRLSDRYPLLVQTKGGHAAIQAKFLLITSNSLPTDWYASAIKKTPWLGRALTRRFDGLIVANTGPSDSWSYYYGAEAQRKLENPDALRREVGLDGLELDAIFGSGKDEETPNWSRDENPQLYD